MDHFPNERLSEQVMLRLPPSVMTRVKAVAARTIRRETDVIRIALLYGLPRLEQQPDVMMLGEATASVQAPQNGNGHQP